MKTIVITGASRGIGKGIADKFLHEGFALGTCSLSDLRLYEAKKEWQEYFQGAQVFALPVDMRDISAVKSFGEKLIKRFPEGIDVLVNNAGNFLPGNLMDEPEGRLEELMQVHLFSAYHLTRALVPSMIKKGAGHIFNLCSVASTRAYPNGGSYGIAKFALRGFTENLRYELRDKKIKVTALTPGAVWTDSWKESGFEENRMMSVEDIANMVWAAYNLSPSANVDNIILRPQLGDL